jgi:protein gp37
MLDTIRSTPHLHWILLTKRPENFERCLREVRNYGLQPKGEFSVAAGPGVFAASWLNGNPPPNVCVMASVEDQRSADERVPHLLRIPAQWPGLSMEPLLGPINFDLLPFATRQKLKGIIVGGESGPKARPCNVEWVRSLVRQGREAGLAVFVKQLGSHVYYEEGSTRKRWLLDDPKGGDPSEWPADLRVREWPG